MSQHRVDVGWPRRAAVMIVCSLLGTGCSHLRDLGPREAPPPGSTSTLGTDFKEAPRGRTIPPAGFGVDLVQTRPDAGPGPVRLASASRAEPPGPTAP